MGIGYFDHWSIGHFSGGVLSQALIQTTGTSTALNLIIANSIHLFIELFEKDVKLGKLAESFENHMTDIIFFFLGWLLSYLTNSSQYIPRSFIPSLWVILGLGFFKDILVEVYTEYIFHIDMIYAIIVMILCFLSGLQLYFKAQ